MENLPFVHRVSCVTHMVQDCFYQQYLDHVDNLQRNFFFEIFSFGMALVVRKQVDYVFFCGLSPDVVIFAYEEQCHFRPLNIPRARW